MGIYSRPIVFAIVSAVVILIGTLITTIIPIFMPSTQPMSGYIKPYTAIELEGRDIYIRESCNACHTQTVRPLRTEVARYGDYSKPEEFAYDRPHLWGSRRTGPDLHRIGGKYPDAWHYKHTVDPRAMFAKSNMPAYAWLAKTKLNTSYTAKKAAVLGLSKSDSDISSQIAAFKAAVTASDYAGKAERDSAVPAELRGEITELDALVAYMQYLGRDVKELVKKETAEAPHGLFSVAEAAEANPALIEEGKQIFIKQCAKCHGDNAKGKIGPNLTDRDFRYGGKDKDLKKSIKSGRKGGMPAFNGILTDKQIDAVIAFIRSIEGK